MVKERDKGKVDGKRGDRIRVDELKGGGKQGV